ncbi:hypothetical protein M9H77_07740 [Catharanthus roseus]|uniref:Uncharacterized protein n=1 Tax=Catharanthus roseus TaxID=4058 RepID=A0ACC0BVS8_CATRO|nr:hypothetical protein M9H77_07740 [Catharanthus roseus]
MTEKRERVFYDLVTKVYIQLPNRNSSEQDVIYENLPKFCCLCKMLGGKQKEKQSKGASNAECPKKSIQTEREHAREPYKETVVPADHPPSRNNPGVAAPAERVKEGNTTSQGDNTDDKDQGKHLSQISTRGLAATRRLVNDEEEEELETTPATGDKGVLKWITSTLVDKGSKKTTGKDKGKMPMGKNEEKGLEKRKDWKVANNFLDYNAGRIAIIWDPRRASLDVVETNAQVIHVIITSVIGRPSASIILRGTRFHDMLCGLGTEGLYANVRFLPSGFISDNSSCIVSLFQKPKIHKPTFKFFNMWCSWSISVIGTKQYTLYYKLKMLKRSLKDLKKKTLWEELHDNPHDA